MPADMIETLESFNKLRLIELFLSGNYSDMVRFEDFKSDVGKYSNWRGHAFEILCITETADVRLRVVT